MTPMSRVLILLAGALAVLSGTASAQLAPVNAEFQASPCEDHRKFRLTANSHSDGSFLVGWSNLSSDYVGPPGVLNTGRRFVTSSGNSGALSSSYITTYGGPDEVDTIPRDSTGFIVVWDQGYGPGLSKVNVQFRLDDGTQGYVNDFVGDGYGGFGVVDDIFPRVGSDDAGRFVVTWHQPQSAYFDDRRRAKLFDRDGSVIGSEIGMCEGLCDYEGDVSMLAGGEFLVVWREGDSLQAQLYDPVGIPAAASIRINGTTPAAQPHVSRATETSFFISWGAGDTHYFVELDFDGTLQNPPVQVVSQTPVARLSSVYRVGLRQAGLNLLATVVDSSGVTYGNEVQINQLPVTSQPVVTAGRGSVMIAWLSDEYVCDVSHGDHLNVAARVFCLDLDEDGICDLDDPCTLDNVGASCADANLCDGEEICDESGVCVAGTPLDCVGGTTCTVDTCEPVSGCLHTAIDPSTLVCLSSENSHLDVRNRADPTRNRIQWKWRRGQTFDQVSLGAPDSTTRYSLCIYDSAGSVDTLVSNINPQLGGEAWTDRDPNGWNYKDKSRAVEGVDKIKLKTGISGRSAAELRGKGDMVPLPNPVSPFQYFDVEPKVSVFLVSSVGTCWESHFGIADVTKNTGTAFKAKARQ